jgi:hypothetical protein
MVATTRRLTGNHLRSSRQLGGVIDAPYRFSEKSEAENFPENAQERTSWRPA